MLKKRRAREEQAGKAGTGGPVPYIVERLCRVKGTI